MGNSYIERQVKSAVRDLFGDKAVRAYEHIGKLAAQQGGDNVIENYKLLGKRSLIALGVAVVAVQVVASTVGFVVSRKSEEQRIEKVVRRVLEEERQAEQPGEGPTQ